MILIKSKTKKDRNVQKIDIYSILCIVVMLSIIRMSSVDEQN